MANVDVTVVEADASQSTITLLGVGRQASTLSKSLTLATEDKAVLDALAARSVGPGTSDATTTRVVLADDQAVDPLTATAVMSAGYQLVFFPTDAPAIAVASAASENHVGEVGGKTIVFDLTLSLDTAAYAAGDLIAETQQCDAFFRKANGTGLVQSLMVIDKDDQKAAIDIYLLSANNTFGTENAAPSISDANAAAILGIISVAAADYKDLGGVSVACIKNIGLPVKAVSATDDLYVAVVSNASTPTYTASGVVLRIGALLD